MPLMWNMRVMEGLRQDSAFPPPSFLLSLQTCVLTHPALHPYACCFYRQGQEMQSDTLGITSAHTP